MPRITPVDWKTLLKIFKMFGCQYKRSNGPSRRYLKEKRYLGGIKNAKGSHRYTR